MTIEEVLEYISAGLENLPLTRLCSWMSSSDTFRRFVDEQKGKVRSRLADAEEAEAREDAFAEMEVARCLLADPRFQVEYEPYGREVRAPDFRVTAPTVTFNVEVKRVREGDAMAAVESFTQIVLGECAKVPSGLGIDLRIMSTDDNPAELMYRLRDAAPSVASQCVTAIKASRDTLPGDDEFSFCADGFGEGCVVTLHRLPNRPPDYPTANLGVSHPVPYTQREFLKFGDVVCSCLGQFRAGMPNVLVVKVHSTTHHDIELPYAMLELLRMAEAGDDDFFCKKKLGGKKKFESVDDFQNQLRLLSGVVVMERWQPIRIDAPHRNLIWLNPGAAESLPEELVGYLAKMTISL